MSDITLAPGEIKLVTLICKHIKTLEVDWDALASEGGYSYAASARNTWNALKRKKLSGEIPATPKKRKNDSVGAGESGMTPSPGAKKIKKGAKAKTIDVEAAAEVELAGMEGEDYTDAGVKEEPTE